MLSPSIRHALACGVVILLVGGCRSLDPAPDLDHAAATVEERLAVRPAWDAAAEAETARPPLPDPLSISAAVAEALDAHPTIGARVAAVARARADLVQADRLPNPRFSITVGIPIDGEGGSPGAVGLMAPLTALLSRPARVATAEAELRAEVLDLADAAVRLAETVAIACVDVHHLRSQLAIDAAMVGELEALVALRTDLVNAGEGTGDAVAVARSALAEGRDRHLRTRALLESAERTLLAVVGRAASTESCPRIDPASFPALTSRVPSETELLEQVLAHRLDVASAVARAEASGARLRVSERERFGAIDATLGFEQNFSDREGLFPGLRFELPLFDLGGARIASQEATARQRAHEAEEALRVAILEVRTAAAAGRGARDRLRVLERERVPATQDQLRLVAARTAAGEGTQVEVHRARLESHRALRDLNQGATDLRHALLAVARAAGGGFAPRLPEPHHHPMQDTGMHAPGMQHRGAPMHDPMPTLPAGQEAAGEETR